MSGKIYPIGIQNFESLRNDGYFYIDKTALIYQLVKTGSYYFLSRPRRFGKSLLISTLEAYFQGKRELFEGLAMEKLEKDWVKYPVLYLDLNTEKYDTPESLENKLNGALVEWEKIYGAEPSEKSLAMRFEGIIKRACRQEGQRVALWLGILTPVLFIAFYYFWTDRLELLPAIFTDNLMVGEHIHRLPVIDLVRLGMIVLVLIIALTNLSARYSLMIVNQRRGILSLVSMMIFLSLTFVIIPGNYYDFMYMFAVPLSFLYAQYFICSRPSLFSNLVFVLLLSACFLTYLV